MHIHVYLRECVILKYRCIYMNFYNKNEYKACYEFERQQRVG